MIKLNAKGAAALALTSALLAGCGGGGGGDGGVAGGGAAPAPVPQTISNVVDFINKLIASNGENTEPIDVNSLTLATDDTSEPQPLP